MSIFFGKNIHTKNPLGHLNTHDLLNSNETTLKNLGVQG